MAETVTPTWATLIRRALDDRAREIHVSLPGRVESYDSATQLAEIRIMIEETVELEDEPGKQTTEKPPILPKVPVAFGRGGGFFASFPLKKGDDGLIVFSERALDRYRATGEQGPPGDQTPHGLGGATFWPGGVVPASKKLADAHADNLVVGRDGGAAIHIRPDDEIHLGGPATSDVVALVATVQQIIDTVAATVIVPGDGGAALKTAISAIILAGSSNVRAD